MEIRCSSSLEELQQALAPINHYFGFDSTPEGAERFGQWIELERMHAAYLACRRTGGAASCTL